MPEGSAVNKHNPDVWFSHRVVLATAVVVGLVLLVAAAWYAILVLLLVFAGVLVAILLTTLGRWLNYATRIPAPWSVIVVVVLLAATMTAVGWLGAPRVTREANEIAQQMPQAVGVLRKQMDAQPATRWLVRAFEEAEPDAPQLVWHATGIVYNTVGAAIGLVVVLFVGLYLAINPTLYTSGLLLVVPPSLRPRTSQLLGVLGYTLRRWMLGQFVTMVAVGVMTGVGLWMLDVPMALTLGLLAFVLEFIPNFGPIIAAIPAIWLAWTKSPQTALYVVILYLVVQQVQSLLITPLVQRKTVWLPPALTITAQVLMGVLLGPIGLLLATPLTAVALVTVKMLYVEDMLGDKVETPENKIKPEDQPPLPDTRPRDENQQPPPDREAA